MSPLMEVPNGFVLDQPQDVSVLPEGFVMDNDSSKDDFFSRLSSDFQKRKENLSEIQKASREGKQTGVEGGAQILGQAIGSLGDVVGEGVVSTSRSLSNEIKEPISNFGRDILSTETGQMGLKALQQGVEYWNQFKDQNPRAARDIEALVNIGAFFTPIWGKSAAGLTQDLVSPITKGIGAVGERLGGAVSNGTDAAKTLLKGRDADSILASRLSNKNLYELKNSLEKGDKVLTLPDVSGDEVKGLLRVVGRSPGGGKDIVSDFLNNRSEYAVKRVGNLLSKRISNVDAYFGNLEDITKVRAEMSAPLYKKAYSEAVDIGSPNLNKFLEDRRIIDAIEEAKRSYGVRSEAPIKSLETLDGVKKVLDDIAGNAYSNNKKQLGASYTILKNDLLKVLDKVSPTYRQARETFAGFKAMEDAQKEGLKFSSLRPEQLKMYLKNLTPSELEAYRIGVRENLQKTVSTTSDGSDPAKRIFGNPQKREQLEVIFGNGKGFNEFSRHLKDEILAADTKFKVLGGSRTDINLSEDGSPLIEAGIDAVRRGRLGIANQITDALATAFERRYIGINRQNAKTLAKILTNKKQGLQAIDRIIKMNEKNSAQKRILSEIKNTLPQEIGIKQ